MAWVLDLDGVVWLGDEVIEGSPGAVDRLRVAGEPLLFITNNSSLTVGQYTAKLERMGIAVEQDELVTSAEAAASLLAPGSTALVCAGPGVNEALGRRPAGRHQRRPHLPLTRRSAPGLRRDPGRGGHGRRRAAGGGREALRRHGRARAPPGARRRRSDGRRPALHRRAPRPAAGPAL